VDSYPPLPAKTTSDITEESPVVKETTPAKVETPAQPTVVETEEEVVKVETPPVEDKSEEAVIITRNITPGGSLGDLVGGLGGFLESVRGTYGDTVTNNLQRELGEVKSTLGGNIGNLNNTTVAGNQTLQIVDKNGTPVKNLTPAEALTSLYLKNSDGTTQTLGAFLAGKPVPANWSGFGQNFDDYFKVIQGFAQDANLTTYYKDPSTSKEYEIESIAFRDTPLILDTNGNGKMDLTNSADGVQFDINGDGTKEQVAWTKGGEDSDSFLTLDRDGDGQITSGKELFGDQHGSTDGYSELRKFDENADGVIDKNDAVYQTLTMWKDVNHDGVSQKEELLSLEKAGVESINLSATQSDDKVFNNDLKLKSTFTRTDTAAKALADSKGTSAAKAKQGLSVDAWLEATV
jgi:hypothetical protein